MGVGIWLKLPKETGEKIVLCSEGASIDRVELNGEFYFELYPSNTTSKYVSKNFSSAEEMDEAIQTMLRGK
jgi:hypothetical protein